MDKVTQQNAAMVERTTAAVQSLGTETENLASLVNRFRTSAVAANTAAHAAPARRPVVGPTGAARAGCPCRSGRPDALHGSRRRRPQARRRRSRLGRVLTEKRIALAAIAD